MDRATRQNEKLQMWKKLLHSTAAASGEPYFSFKSLWSRYKSGLSPGPQSIEIVLRRMQQSKEIEKMADFIHRSDHWFSWVDLNAALTKPLYALLDRHPEFDFDPDIVFVIPSLIKEQASRVWKRLEESGSEEPFSRGVVQWSVLKGKVKDICPTDQALELAIVQLKMDKRVRISEEGKDSEKMIRFEPARENGFQVSASARKNSCEGQEESGERISSRGGVGGSDANSSTKKFVSKDPRTKAHLVLPETLEPQIRRRTVTK